MDGGVAVGMGWVIVLVVLDDTATPEEIPIPISRFQAGRALFCRRRTIGHHYWGFG